MGFAVIQALCYVHASAGRDMSRITLVTTASPCAKEMRQFISAAVAYRESSVDDVDLLIC